MTDQFFIATYLGIPKKDAMKMRSIYRYFAKHGFGGMVLSEDAWYIRNMEMFILYWCYPSIWHEHYEEQR